MAFNTDRQSLPQSTADVSVPYGGATDAPAVGDWDGNGSDTIGVFRSGVFYLRNDAVAGPGQLTIPFGDRGDVPLSGRWTAGIGDLVGVARSY